MSQQLLDELHKNKDDKFKLRNEVIQWQTQNGNDYTHEVTLTFPINPSNRWHAESLFKTFKFRLIDRCLKFKQNQNIKMAVYLEGEISNKLFHYHCAMRCPAHMTYDYFSRRIFKTWQDTVKANNARVKIKKYTDSGWLSYCSKEINMSNTDVVSEHNSL
jgi:hypothetical protein